MTDTRPIDRVLQDAIGTVPGVVALATSRAGTIYEGAFGKRDLSGDTPMTLDTVFFLASMTKAVVSAGALRLVEQGKLSLDAAISDVIPELAAPRVLEGFAADGAPKLRPAAGSITLRQLLSHSAGFGYNTWNPEIGEYMERTGLPRVPTTYAELGQTPLLFDPGTRWNYGINTDVVGLASEQGSGQRLDQYLAEHVLGPLGMHDTVVTLSVEQRSRLARMHGRVDGVLAPMDFAAGVGPSFCMGGGALCGTGPDYLRFTRMILNGGVLDGTRVLSAETVAEMGQNQLGSASVRMMRSAMPSRSADAEFFPGMDKKWSTAFMLNTEKAPTGRNPGSMAWAGIANTYFWIDPTAEIAGVILTQILPFADPGAMGVFAAFERAVYDAIA